MVHIVGIDCAAQDENIGITYSEWKGVGKFQIKEVYQGFCYCKLFDYIKKNATPNGEELEFLIAFDAPLGWPQGLGEFLCEQSAGNPDFPIDFTYDAKADCLFTRATDRIVKKRMVKENGKAGVLPLSVGADKIARASFKALEIINNLRNFIQAEFQVDKFSLTWTHDAKKIPKFSMIEVYPAATLFSWNKTFKGYKSDEKVKERILEFLGESDEIWSANRCDVKPMDHLDVCKWEKAGSKKEYKKTKLSENKNTDAFDSLICAFTGKEFLEGNLTGPDKWVSDGIISEERLKKEGWIWTNLNLG